MKKEEIITKYGLDYYKNQLEKNKNRNKEWQKSHKENLARNSKKWSKKNKEKINEYHKKYYKNNKRVFALNKISTYRQQDIIKNRGECTLTVDEFISIIDKGCYWCGETDWHKLGADRINITKPHTKDNCVCSCHSCNCGRELKRKVYQYTKEGKLVSTYESVSQANKITGVHNIDRCCNGKYKTAGGYIWSYYPL